MAKEYIDLKTRIYIDASNIILSLRELGHKVDFLKLQVYLRDRFRTDEIYYFTPNLKGLEEDLKKLEEKNFKVIKKEIYFYQNKIKANCDVEISHYITSHIKDKLVDKIVLLSGDGDFSLLLDYAKENKIEFDVLAATTKSTGKFMRKRYFPKVYFLTEIAKVKDIFTEAGPGIENKKEKIPVGHASQGDTFSINQL